MRQQYRIVALVVVFLALWGGASGVVFVLAGPQLAVYSVVGGVPILALVGFLYARGSLGGDEVGDERAREVGDRFADVYGAYREIQDAYPTLLSGVDPPFERIIDDLESQGVSVDRETGATSPRLLGSPDVSTLDAIEDDIEDLDRRLKREAVESAREEVREINAQLRRLDGVVDVRVPRRPDDLPGPNDLTGGAWWRTLGRELEDHRESSRGEIERAADAIRASMREADDVDEADVEGHISRAEAAPDVETGVEELLAARDTFREEASGTFGDHRRELLALAEAVRSTDVDEYVDMPRMEEFEAAVEDVELVDDAMEMDELRRRGDRLQSVCTDIVRDLEERLGENLETLRDADVPEDYYRRPDAADGNYTTSVASADTLAAYRSAWMDAAADLTDALDGTERKARVASMYADIEDHVELELRQTGRVTAEDLPIKRDQEQFLGLYARRHDVAFDPSVPELTASGGGDRYTVTVRVSFEDGGEERTARVSLEGAGYEESTTVTTYLADVVEFEEVPYGEHTVRAVPDTEDNEPAETTVGVEDDVTVDLEMAAVTIRERLCSDLDGTRVETYLEEMDGRFDEVFESDGYLSTEMEFPIADEYVPCLLAAWADQRGHSVTRSDDVVLVYDAETVTEELRMVARHNLDPGGSMAYGTLRERFLSAPVPDEAIRNTAADIGAVAAGDEALHKQDD